MPAQSVSECCRCSWWWTLYSNCRLSDTTRPSHATDRRTEPPLWATMSQWPHSALFNVFCYSACLTLTLSFLANVRYMSLPVHLLSVCLWSVTFVHPTQATDNFGNVSMPFGMLAICWHPGKILRRSSQGNPSIGGVSDFGPVFRQITASMCGGIYARVYCIL